MALWDHPCQPVAALELAHPLAEAAGQVEESAFVLGLPEDVALSALAVWQLVMEWSQTPPPADLETGGRQMDQWEVELLHASADRGGLWAPLAVIVGELRRPPTADPVVVARACLVASEHAQEAAAEAAALLFAQAAALAWPENPRYAWIVGKLLCACDRRRDAEMWLRRAERIAVATRDWETQARSLNSLGNLEHDRGDYRSAWDFFARGLRVARRYRLREREAFMLHDQFVLAIRMDERTRAEQLAAAAFRRYGPRHPNLPRLAHDMAHFWAEQGYFDAALRVYKALLPHSFERTERLRLLGSLARSAGACGESDAFEEAWAEAWTSIRTTRGRVPPAALMEIGLGAASLGDWERALEALNHGRALALELGEHDCVARADAALDSVAHQVTADSRRPRRREVGAPADVLSREVEKSLS